MATSVRFLLLGRFELTVDGVTVGPDDFERRSGAELLQLLALAPGQRLHREQVMEALWPGAEVESAANSLRKAATFARKATSAPDAIVVRDQVVALFPDRHIDVDVEIIDAARAEDEESVAAAVEAYHGDLLPDAPYAEWAVRPRDRLHRHMVALLVATRRWDDLLALDPANEEAVLAVMDRALAVGDRQTVLRHYDELETRLRDELGVTPSPAAVVLRDRALDLGGPTDLVMSGMRIFLMTNIEGFDRVRQVDPEAMTASLAVHDRLINDAVQDGGGIVFKHTDDGVCAVFGSAAAAVTAAVAIQQALGAVSWEHDQPRVRIGVEVGEAEHRNGEWSGVVLDRTARILETANGDQIVCSELVASLAAPGLGSAISMVDLGLFRLPGLAPTTLHRVDAEGIERRTSLRGARLSGRSLGPSREVLIGRDDELDDVRHLLTTERLVTVVGPGGAGKTSLARHVAGLVIEDYPGGVWMCQFGTLGEARSVPSELLAAIGAMQHTDATVVESIVRSLGDRRTLIVFDNCEHLLEAIASLAHEILDRCPGTTLLVTSREPLGLGAEQQYRLGQLSRDAAIELFVTGARRQGTMLDSTDATVARVCARLDDLPLAVQLASARTRTLDPGTIESLLDDRFAYLRSSTVDRPDHHQTLGTAIAWSFDALSPELQHLLCKLSAFTGWFTLDEARSVASESGSSTASVVDGLDLLVRRSLVTGPEPVGGETAYRLLESIRLFARDRGDFDAALARHLDHFSDAAEQNRIRQQHDSLSALNWFRSRWSDLRQAQAHAVDTGQLGELCRIINASTPYCRVVMQFEVVDWCEHGLEAAPQRIYGPEHVETLANWASLSIHRGQNDLAEALAARASAADSNLPEALLAETLISWSRGDHAMAAQTLERMLGRDDIEPSLEAGGLMFKAIVLSGTGGDVAPVSRRLEDLAAGRGPVFEAQDRFVRAVALARTDPVTASVRLDESQFLTDRYDLVDIGTAVRLVRGWVVPNIADTPLDVLEVTGGTVGWLQERGLWSYAFVQLGGSAVIFAQVGRVDLAVTLLASCAANGFTTSFRADLIDALLSEAEMTDPDSYADWWETGQRLDASAACSLALSGVEQLLRPS
ncbi:MAG: NB-ARC domain-containing protein [Acidimicrobiales bacterium]